jgi:putative MFS transporter
MWGVAGVLYVGLLARLVLPYAGWRVYTAAAALPNCLLLLLRLRIPESPRFLLLRGRATEAARVLRAVAAENGRADALPKRLRLAPLPPPPSGRARLRALTQPPLRAPLLSLCAVWLGLSSAYAGFTFWLPALLAARGIDGLSASETYLVMTAAEVCACARGRARVRVRARACVWMRACVRVCARLRARV